MSLFGKWNTLLLATTLLVAVGGCSQMDSSGVDDEKEPHFVLGKSRVNAMDYDGAIRAFEESLDANPHSAPAHYQLAILFDSDDKSVGDPAAAIYHYRECLKYDPKIDNADTIAGRIEACKQKLAENVLQLPSTPATQQQLERLTEENHRLHDQITQWQAYYAAQQAAARTNPPTPQYNYTPQQPVYNSQQPVTSPTPDDVTPQSPSAGNVASGSGVSDPRTSTRSSTTSTTPHRATESRTSRPRTHTVARGETLASIARKAGVSIPALEAANPYVNPNKIRAGQVLNLPPP